MRERLRLGIQVLFARLIASLALAVGGCSSDAISTVSADGGFERTSERSSFEQGDIEQSGFEQSRFEHIGAAIIGGSPAGEADFPAVVSLGGCSGTLVHPLLVVFAEHCGTAITEVRFGASADKPDRVVSTDRCRSFPGAKLGDGTDLAYCVLQEPVVDIEPERVLAGCEVDDFSVGQPAVVVGFGIDQEGGTYGRKRFATTSIMAIGDELLMEQGDVDTCRGDSGGPVFIERRDADGRVQRRLVGVTSAGSEAECGLGIGHYVNLTRKVDWLEEHAQLDLTPCFEQGVWSPTPRCIAAPTLLPAEHVGVGTTDAGIAGAGAADAGAADIGPSRVSAEAAATDAGATSAGGPELGSCGAPFDGADDERSPAIQWTSPVISEAASTGKRRQRIQRDLPDGGAYVEFELAVEATDSGLGVEQVVFSLSAHDGELLFQRVDQRAPYGLPILRVPPGHFTLQAEARNFAGNTASTALDLQIGDDPVEPASPPRDATCSSSPYAPSKSLWQTLAIALFLAGSRRRARWAKPTSAS